MDARHHIAKVGTTYAIALLKNAKYQRTENLGKSRQVDGDGKSWNTGYRQLGEASLGKSRQV